ncbi:hypothetical protein ACIB24_16370 [Spongisporangium articulatum]|uniref:STAS domain-containing protein n=1 Tax=Spongisporangium articulatum TaxID=3362603 RepID=A0ABW8ASS9_9ACTN
MILVRRVPAGSVQRVVLLGALGVDDEALVTRLPATLPDRTRTVRMLLNKLWLGDEQGPQVLCRLDRALAAAQVERLWLGATPETAEALARGGLRATTTPLERRDLRASASWAGAPPSLLD